MKPLKTLVAGLCTFTLLAAGAQGFPDKKIDLIVPYGPGGGLDSTTRVLAGAMAADLKVPMIVINKPGASGGIGNRYVADAPKDGYTLLVDGSYMSVASALYKAPMVEYGKNLVPVGTVLNFPLVLVAANSTPASNVQELIALARKDPSAVSVAVDSPVYRFLALQFNSLTGLDIPLVTYTSSGPALQDLIPGRVSFMIETAAVLLPQIRDGRVKPLAVLGDKRNPMLPKVPTLSESGLKGFEIQPIGGIFAPAGTPPERIKKLNESLMNALARSDVQQAIEKLNLQILAGKPEEYDGLMRKSIARYEDIATKAGVVKD